MARSMREKWELVRTNQTEAVYKSESIFNPERDRKNFECSTYGSHFTILSTVTPVGVVWSTNFHMERTWFRMGKAKAIRASKGI